MAFVKHFHRFRPNVGTTLLLAAGLALPSASWASYTVLDDVGPFVTPILAAADAPSTGSQAAETAYPVPFFQARTRLGPRGRRALEALVKSAPKGASFVVVGRADAGYDEALANARAKTLRTWLVRAGVNDASITVEIVEESVPNALPKVFDCEVRVTPAHGSAPASKSEYQLPKPSDSSTQTIGKILTLYKKAELNERDTILLLHGLDTQTTKTALPAVSKDRPTTVMTTPTVIPVASAAHTWHFGKNRTVRETVEAWAAEAGWRPPDWRPSDPYRFDSDGVIQGSFIDAINSLSDAVPALDFDLSLKKRTIVITEH